MPRTSKSGAVGKTDAAQVAAETLSVFKAGRYKSFDGVSVTLDKRRLAQANKAAVCIADPLSQFPRPPTDPKAPPPEIILFNGDSFDAARWLVANRDGGDATASATSASGSDKPHGTATAQKNSGCSRPLILDFASDSNPGGGWRGGQQGTQEEALCRCSSLGVALETAYEFSGARYMPRMGCVYVPECVVIRANESLGYCLQAPPLWVGVVAGALRNGDADTKALLEDKTAGVVRVCGAYKHPELVLGAWGCGAFGNDPSAVAKAFAAALKHNAYPTLRRVVFAIPGNRTKAGSNFSAFQRVFMTAQVAESSTSTMAIP